MNRDRKTAIVVGTLFITAAVAGILTYPSSGLLAGPDYLAKVAENGNQVIVGALFEVVMAFAGASIAIWLYPVLRRHDEALALGAVGFRTFEAVCFLIAAVALLSLLTLSREYVNEGAPDVSYFQTLGTLLLAVGDWAGQVIGAIAFSLGALMYYTVFFRSRLIPQWLSGWGLLAALVWLAAASLSMFGLIDPLSTTRAVLSLPIAANEMVLAAFLILKGFSPSATAPEPTVAERRVP